MNAQERERARFEAALKLFQWYRVDDADTTQVRGCVQGADALLAELERSAQYATMTLAPMPPSHLMPYTAVPLPPGTLKSGDRITIQISFKDDAPAGGTLHVLTPADFPKPAEYEVTFTPKGATDKLRDAAVALADETELFLTGKSPAMSVRQLDMLAAAYRTAKSAARGAS